jgi:hypothetical protein
MGQFVSFSSLVIAHRSGQKRQEPLSFHLLQQDILFTLLACLPPSNSVLKNISTIFFASSIEI